MPMPTKRAILSELTRDELRANLDFYELDVYDRRVKAQLIDALAGSFYQEAWKVQAAFI